MAEESRRSRGKRPEGNGESGRTEKGANKDGITAALNRNDEFVILMIILMASLNTP